MYTRIYLLYQYFLHENIYNLLNYLHYLLWASLEDNIPSRPVAVI